MRKPRNAIRAFGLFVFVASAALGADRVFAQDDSYGETHELVMGLHTTLRTMDPGVAPNMRGDFSIIGSIYSSLTRVDENGNVAPVAAESWEQTSELTWVFKLRDDVRYSNGAKLTAETVKWNLERLINIKDPSWIVISMRNVAGAKVVDPLTVEISLSNPDIHFPRRLAGVFMLEPEWVASNNPDIDAMGSGPYKLVSFNPETGATLEANENFYGEAPAFKKVNFRVVTDSAARINGLKAGEIDAAAVIDPLDLPQLETSGELVVGIIPSTRVQIIRFNTLVKPMDDKRVRQAINYAIDKAAITKALFRDMVPPARSQMITEMHEGFNTDLDVWPYDPEKAKALLAEAGHPNGFDVEMVFGKGTYVGGEQAAQIVVAQLAEVGIRAQLNILPGSVHRRRLIGDDQAAMTWMGYSDPATIASETLSYIGNTHVHTRGPIPPAYNAALKIAQTAPTKEIELEAVKKATQAAADDALAVFLWELPQTFAYSDKIVWKIRRDDWTLPYDVTPAE
jgi:peptide/nickel transport system substrate-binding protein